MGVLIVVLFQISCFQSITAFYWLFAHWRDPCQSTWTEFFILPSLGGGGVVNQCILTKSFFIWYAVFLSFFVIYFFKCFRLLEMLLHVVQTLPQDFLKDFSNGLPMKTCFSLDEVGKPVLLPLFHSFNPSEGCELPTWRNKWHKMI